jgi:DNA mismatch endonuclease Vsr
MFKPRYRNETDISILNKREDSEKDSLWRMIEKKKPAVEIDLNKQMQQIGLDREQEEKAPRGSSRQEGDESRGTADRKAGGDAHSFYKLEEENLLEFKCRQLLLQLGFSGLRIQDKNLPGTPDIVVENSYIKLAILVQGDLWHSSGKLSKVAVKQLTKNNIPGFNNWGEKSLLNSQRDRKVRKQLREQGFIVVSLLESRINQRNPIQYVSKAIAYAVMAEHKKKRDLREKRLED